MYCFLFAQLRQGYINPPEGYKSRRVRAQEIKNQQLEAEIAALKQLEAQENELRFELFKAKLTEDDLTRLEEEARKQINRKIGLSTERQIEVNKEEVLKRWFEQQKGPKGDDERRFHQHYRTLCGNQLPGRTHVEPFDRR